MKKAPKRKTYTVKLTQNELDAIYWALGNFVTYGITSDDKDTDRGMSSAAKKLRKIGNYVN